VDLTIDGALRGRVMVGLLLLEDLSVRDADTGLADAIDAEARGLRERHGDGRSAEVPGAEQARALYKALGIDPTKTRPSSEALTRRLLKGESLHRVNTLVDALNLCSLRAQLPFGLYDADRLRPPVVLRRGAAGESYEGIRKGPVNVEGRPVLVDSEGPFGNPTSDSARTMITLATRRALVVAYAPAGYARARLERVLDETAETLTRWSQGRATWRALLA
jgi:DNA/RNA-binding domain of Phe-tRNA-synthetase-like protein